MRGTTEHLPETEGLGVVPRPGALKVAGKEDNRRRAVWRAKPWGQVLGTERQKAGACNGFLPTGRPSCFHPALATQRSPASAQLSRAVLVGEVGRSQSLERHPEWHVLDEPAAEIQVERLLLQGP